ncbi:flagellar basal-body MS-ring/collar protein FliF [Roseovarius sp. D22-M7]|uniref:flagellar basal-body MS-ring/collar protein FliF n=1 Tax=Roseovarius sp. D22-M7 TaxID=3127116 RepID=UPI00300F9161
MQQIVTLWHSLDTRRRVIVGVATLAMFVAVLALARMASAPSMTLLYSGLEGAAAGEIVEALDQRGVAHEVRGTSIFVDSAQRDSLRMSLAGEGLPASTSKGYELLDGMSGFGTTSQMFDAAYWRAKEGELARTIVAHPAIDSARVHLASTGSNPFQRDIRQSASVSITAQAPGITAKHARALRFLVASAVAGLTPDDVSVIDAEGGLIGPGEDVSENAPDTRIEALRARAQRLLEARVGAGNAVVEVALDTETRTEAIRERRFDPEGRVAISTDTEETSSTSTDEGGGVTVASNVPDGDAGSENTSQSQRSDTRERVNYEVSTTEREITKGPGAIKRLTVAVLVNGSLAPDETGTPVFQPRPQEELDALAELVSSAVGLNPERGDVLTIKTMQFETPQPAGTLAVPGLFDRFDLDVMSLLQVAVLALVALILGLFVLRPILARPAAHQPARLDAPAAQDDTARNEAPAESAPLTGEIEDGEFDSSRLSVVSGESPQNSLQERFPGQTDEDPVVRLRNLIGQRQEESVEILRSWLEGEEEKV